MKKVCILVFCLLITANLLFAQKSKNIRILTKGSWNLEKVDNEDPSKRDRINIIFLKNGTLKIKSLEENKYENGTWKISEDGLNLGVLTSDEPDSITLKIMNISAKSMSLDRSGSIAAFVNVPNSEKAKKSPKSKKITGSWQMIEKNGKKMDGKPVIFQFNADGTAWNSREDEEAMWRTEKNQLILSVNDNIEILDYTLSKDKKTLTISVRDDALIFTKTDQKISKPAPKKEEVHIEEIPDENADASLEIKDLTGNWKVIRMDDNPIQDKSLIFELKSDLNFNVLENGSVERSGKWELKKGKLFLRDSEKYNSEYSVKIEADGTLVIRDYYGVIYLTRS